MIVIDRFEGDWAVIEWEDRVFNFPRGLLPEDAREGDVIALSVALSRDETERRRKRIEELEKDLFKN